MESTAKKGILTSIMLVMSFVYHSFGVLFVILVTLMTIDYVTGLTGAWIQSKQSSRVGIIGIIKKIGYIALVVIAILFDFAIIYATEQFGMTLPISSIFGVSAICWLISNEMLSIIENLEELGVPTPKFLNQAIEKFKDFVENLHEKDGTHETEKED